MEPVVIFIRDEVGKTNLGDRYEKYMPFLLTIFFFILINALIGLIPGTANVVGNIAFTADWAIWPLLPSCSARDKHYWSHILNPPVPLGVKPIMVPWRVIGHLHQAFCLNYSSFCEHDLGAYHYHSELYPPDIHLWRDEYSPRLGDSRRSSILLAVFIYLIEILVVFIQAYIFANLTAVFIGQAFEGGHEEANGHQHAEETVSGIGN